MATPVTADRASLFAAGVFVCLSWAATPCHAQDRADASLAARAAPTPVSASEVYLACRHPSVKRPGNTPKWEKLARLCSHFRVPPAGARLTRSALTNWTSASRAEDLPSAGEIREAARDVRNGIEDTLRILGGRDSLAAPEIRFEPNRAELDSVQRTLIARVARDINRHLTDPKARLVVTGVADDVDGKDMSANQSLARFRAKVVASELVNAGVDPAKIATADIVVSPRGGTDMIAARQVASRGAIVDIIAPSAVVRHAEYTIPARRNLMLDDPTASTAQPATPAAGAAPTRSTMSLSTVATGLTDVMLDRATEQTQMYVLDRAARRLCDTTAYASAGYLRQTCGFFKDTYDLQRMRGLRSLRLAFESDVRGIPERLAFQAIKQRISSGAPERYVDLGQSVMFTLHLVEQIEQGSDPMEVFSNFDRDSTLSYRGLTQAVEVRDARTPLSSALRRYARFAAKVDAARDDLGEYWSDSVLPTDTVLTYALRSAVVNLRPGTVIDDAERRVLAELASDKLPGLLDAYREIDAEIAEMIKIADRLRSENVAGDETRSELYAQFAGGMVDISAAALMPGSDRRSEVRKLVLPVRTVISSARSGRYADALHGFTDLVEVLTDSFPDVGFPNEAWKEGEAFRVFALAVNVSEAESQAEVSTALNTFVGQSRDFFSKRADGSPWRVAVNGYVGAGGGLEWVANPDTADTDWTRGQQIAVSLPIGVEYSGSCGHGWSCGVFSPLVDLGAIASARLNDPDTETFPEGELGRIFTPGLYFVLGIPGVPLSVGVGGTYAPGARLREITGSDGEEVDAFRLGMFLGVDIPLFP